MPSSKAKWMGIGAFDLLASLDRLSQLALVFDHEAAHTGMLAGSGGASAFPDANV
jgi:hypothetical protein